MRVTLAAADDDLLGERTDEAAAEHPVTDGDGRRRRSATSATTPANSLPGTKGSGAVIWYSSAITSTSGKLTAAAWTRTRTWPAPQLGRGELVDHDDLRSAVGAADRGAHGQLTA